jgi:hypothetical protein
MVSKKNRDRLDRQTVEELTGLLRYDYALEDLRKVLRRQKLDPQTILLAVFCEDEFGHECGVVVTPDARVYEYTRKTASGRSRGRLLQWNDRTGDMATRRKWGTQIGMALKMAKAGVSEADLQRALKKLRASERSG